MSKLVRIIIAIFVAGMSVVALSPSVSAFDPFEETCDGSAEASSSSVCQDNASGAGQNITNPNDGIIPRVANIVAAVGGLIAVIFIMINGFNFMTSGGDSAKLSKARDGLIYAAIGLVVIVLARTIIAVILRYL